VCKRWDTLIIAGIVARVDVFEALPMLDKDLFEDIGGLARLCQHQSAPSEGLGLEGMERFYHASRSESTPHRFAPCLLTPSLALETQGVQGGSKMKFPSMLPLLSSPFAHFFSSLCSFLYIPYSLGNI